MALVKALRKTTKAAKKAAKASEKATQKGVRFSKKKDIKDGMPSREEARIDAELRTARVAKGSRKPSVTVGKKSDPAKFDPTELLSMSAKKRIQKMVDIERKQRLGTSTKAEDAFLKAARQQDTDDLRRRNVRISQSSRGKPKKKERTDYVDPETGEIFGKPTERAIKQAAANFVARGMSQKARSLLAQLEKPKKELQGPRASGKRFDESEVVTEAARKRIKEQKEKERKRILGDFDKFKKGGAVKKKNSGGMDYRMNKGGMLISSVDRRKKK